MGTKAKVAMHGENMHRIVKENGFSDVQEEMVVCMEARRAGMRLRRVMTRMGGEIWV